VRDTSHPESLFFLAATAPLESEKRRTRVVFVQLTGETQYASEIPEAEDAIEEQPFTGDFGTVEFAYWPGRKTYRALEFEPPGFVLGMLGR
jgi:hypothetical protein